MAEVGSKPCEDDPSSSDSEAHRIPLLRPKVRKACSHCRRAKTKCEQSVSPCTRCRLKGLDCDHKGEATALTVPEGRPQDALMALDGTISPTSPDVSPTYPVMQSPAPVRRTVSLYASTSDVHDHPPAPTYTLFNYSYGQAPTSPYAGDEEPGQSPTRGGTHLRAAYHPSTAANSLPCIGHPQSEDPGLYGGPMTANYPQNYWYVDEALDQTFQGEHRSETRAPVGNGYQLSVAIPSASAYIPDAHIHAGGPEGVTGMVHSGPLSMPDVGYMTTAEYHPEAFRAQVQHDGSMYTPAVHEARSAYEFSPTQSHDTIIAYQQGGQAATPGYYASSPHMSAVHSPTGTRALMDGQADRTVRNCNCDIPSVYASAGSATTPYGGRHRDKDIPSDPKPEFEDAEYGRGSYFLSATGSTPSAAK